MRRRFVRQHGLSALQAVLLVGVALFIVIGVRAAWRAAQQPFADQATRAATGQELVIGTDDLPDEESDPSADDPAADQPFDSARMADLLWDLYFTNKRLSPAELAELERRLTGINDWTADPFTDLALAEVHLRQGRFWEGLGRLISAVNPLQLLEAIKDNTKRARLAIHAAEASKRTARAGDLTYDAVNRRWRSQGGLEYGMGSQQGNRVKHVLEHLTPDPTKPNHTVFNLDRKRLIETLDEAWQKRGTPVPGDPGAFVIDMGRAIGTNGETKIRIIVKPGTQQVITAYPWPH